MGSKMLKIMPEYQCFPLWLKGDGIFENISPDDLPISNALKIRLTNWQNKFDSTLNHDYPPESGFKSLVEEDLFEEEGRKIWTQILEELHSEYDIQYFSVKDNKIYRDNISSNFGTEKSKMPERSNFYASFNNINKHKIKETFELFGWTSRKESWTDFELTNDWAKLVLDGADNEPLLHGIVAFNSDTIKVFDEIFNTLRVQYTYEFYDSQKSLILTKKSTTL
jgi:hypothetical protein